MDLMPLNGHVLVRLLEPESRTAGGLFLPDTVREPSAEGVVRAGHRALSQAHVGVVLPHDQEAALATFRRVLRMLKCPTRAPTGALALDGGRARDP